MPTRPPPSVYSNSIADAPGHDRRRVPAGTRRLDLFQNLVGVIHLAASHASAPIGMYSMKRNSAVDAGEPRSGTTSNSVSPRIAIALILIGWKPARRAASIPASTRSSPSRRAPPEAHGVERVQADVNARGGPRQRVSGPDPRAGCHLWSAQCP